MLEVTGNLWSFHVPPAWAVITTNGAINRNGYAVMGRGVAYQATQQFPGIAKLLAYHIRAKGNVVGGFPQFRLITMPVKHSWEEPADLDLIWRSLIELKVFVDEHLPLITKVYLPRPGCGNGRLAWADVRPMVEAVLDTDQFVVVEVNP